MQLLTVARRADFGYSLRSRFDNARNRLSSGVSYSKAVRAAATLDKSQIEFHEFTYLAGLVSLAEALVADIGSDFLVRYPGHLKDKNVSLDGLAEGGSIGATVESLASKTINDWSYGPFPVLVKQVVSLFDKKAVVSPDVLDQLTEIKATRDVYVHGGGRINKVYLSKARPLARSDKVGAKLELGQPYIEKAETCVNRFIAELERIVPDELKHMGRTATLRAMWNATVLSTMVPFETGWTIVDDNMVRPNDEGLVWAWSGSEQMLLDFFLGIYSEDYPGRKYDVMSALRRWPATTNEGKVIMSWFDSPFWF